MDRYWVGGDGDWSDNTNHWAASTGGAPGASKPTSSDNVFFDSNSHTASYTVTINETADFADMTWANPASGSPTLGGTFAPRCYGSMTLVAGMTWSNTNNGFFSATSTGKTITMAGVVLSSNASWTFNGVGGGWTLQDAFNIGSKSLALTAGTLDTNGQTVTMGAFSCTGATARTLTLGASTVNVTGASGWTISGSNVTFNCDTSTLVLTTTAAFAGGAQNYNIVQLNGTAHTVSGGNVIETFTRTGTNTKTDTMTVTDNFTVSGTFTLAGFSIVNRLTINTSTFGTTKTITVNGAWAVSNTDFIDITGAGTASRDLSAITGGSGDAGGNSGFTFTTPATSYWVGNGGSFSDATNHWANASGGTPNTGRSPLPQDTSIINASSISVGSQTITQDLQRIGTVTLSAVTNNPAYNVASITCVYYGSLTFGTHTVTQTAGFTFAGRGSYTITTNGKTFGQNVVFQMVGGTYSLQDAFTMTANTMTLSNGTLTTNGYTITVPQFSTGTGTKTLNAGSSTFAIGSGNWNHSGTTNATLNMGTSTIKFIASSSARTFASGGSTFTYYNLWNAQNSTASIAITDNSVFSNEIKCNTNGRIFTITAGKTVTAATWTISGAAGTLTTIESATAATHTLTKSGGSTVSCDYMTISYSVASPASTFYAGTHSTDSGNNTNWTFTAPPSGRSFAYIYG